MHDETLIYLIQKWSPKFIFLNEKKIKKIPLIFDIDIFDFERQILAFFDIA